MENQPADGDGGEHTPLERTPLERTAGGQPTNRNAMRHGLRSRRLFALGELPPSMRAAGKSAVALRLALEQASLDRHGSISLTAAASISTAARWERVAGVAGHLLRAAEQDGDMTPAERRTAIERLSERIAAASERRDKSIAALRLDCTPSDLFDALYAMPAVAALPPSDASDTAVER